MLTDCEFYYWSTDEAHDTNETTMHDFLENHLTEDYEIEDHDSTYAEIAEAESGFRWAVHASGDGDFTNHKVQFVPLGFV